MATATDPARRRPYAGPGAVAEEVLGADPAARRILGVSIGFSVLAQCALLGFLVLVSVVVDRAFMSGADLGEVTGLLVAGAAVVALRAAALWAAEVTAQRASGRLRRTLRLRLVRGLLAEGPLPSHHRRRSSGELSTTVGNGVDAMDPWVTAYLPALVLAAVGPFLVFAAVLVLDPLSTLVLLFAGPMLILLLAVIGRQTRDLTARRLEELGWLGAFFGDLLAGIGTLKAHNRSEDVADRIEEASQRFGRTTMAVLRTAFQTSLVMEWAATAATALVAVVVSFRLVGDRLTFGVALAVLVLTPEFFAPLRRLALEYHAGQTGNASWQRIAPLVDAPGPGGGAGRDVRPTGAITTPPAITAPPAITVEGVRFTHHGAGTPALDGVDLHIPAGATVALVGPTGAGKSTLAALLLRFAEPSAGTIAVDGRPLGALDARRWRASTAWVPQNPTLFAGTVADNLRLGAPHAAPAEVAQALADAHAERFVADLPDGVETRMGEGGLRLSGGQRQRIAIARALLRDAPFVVLDEYTAHLDSRTAEEVGRAVDALLAQRSALVIAHRLRTVRSADAVAVMESGRVLDVGSHDELLGRCATYARLVADQRDGFVDVTPGPYGGPAT